MSSFSRVLPPANGRSSELDETVADRLVLGALLRHTNPILFAQPFDAHRDVRHICAAAAPAVAGTRPGGSKPRSTNADKN